MILIAYVYRKNYIKYAYTKTCRFSIGASKWQVQFMQKQDNEVKDTYIAVYQIIYIVHVYTTG